MRFVFRLWRRMRVFPGGFWWSVLIRGDLGMKVCFFLFFFGGEVFWGGEGGFGEGRGFGEVLMVLFWGGGGGNSVCDFFTFVE